MDKIILAIQQLLETAVAVTSSPIENIKRVFYGDPKTIASDDLPALAIQPIGTEYIQRGSRYDEKNHTVEVRLVYNAKDFFKTNPTEVNKVYAVQKSIQQIEESNSQETLSNTVCGVIQKNSTLPLNGANTATLAKVQTVDYTFSNSRGFPTYEVIVTVNATAIGDR